jgi:type IV pilus assembly protein PilE
MISKTCNQVRGFTLIEVMIVVAIIGILAAIAYPSYRDQMIKSRRAEGKATLVAVAQAVEKCRTLYGRYDSPGAAPYDCAAAQQTTGANFVESENGFYRVTSTAIARTTFTLQAAPQQAQQADALCGNLTLDQASRRGMSGTGTLADCW